MTTNALGFRGQLANLAADQIERLLEGLDRAQLRAFEDMLAEWARASFSDFLRQAWDLLEPGTPLVWGWHLSAICAHLEAVDRGEIRNLLVSTPPGSMKSLSVSVLWPAWCWTRRPELRFIAASYSEALALRDAVKSRAVITSDWYRERFSGPAGWQLSGDQNVKSFYVNSRSGFRASTTVGGAGTGLRADRIIIDDPMNATDAFSQAVRRQVIDWWRYTIGNRLADMRTGSRVVIMQRLHEEDLAGYLLNEERGQWEHLMLPSEFEEARRYRTKLADHPDARIATLGADPRKAEGELLFPARFPREVLDRERERLGSIGFPGQHQQRPTAAEGGMFKASWWRFWRYAGQPEIPELAARTVILPERFDEQALSWDCSFKDTKTSDLVAGGAWGRRGADRFLLDLDWRRMDFPETVRAFKAQVQKFPRAALKLIEDKANGPAVIATLKHEISGIVAVNPEGGKESRAAATSPQVESGNVYLPLPAPWRDRYIEEHKNFPLGAHDDAVDQQSQMLLRWGTRSAGADRTRALVATAAPAGTLSAHAAGLPAGGAPPTPGVQPTPPGWRPGPRVAYK